MEKTNVLLVPATKDDIPILITLEQSVAGPYTYSAMLDVSDWEEELTKCDVFLIKLDGATVGNVSLEHKSPEHLYISGLMIRPEYQGKGIARQVLSQVLHEHTNTQRVDLLTHPDNPARKLYESLGFVVESRIENCWGDGEPRLLLALIQKK